MFSWMNGLNLFWHYSDEHDILYGHSAKHWMILKAEKHIIFDFHKSPKDSLILIYLVWFPIYLSFSLCKLFWKDLLLSFKFYFSLWHIWNDSESLHTTWTKNSRKNVEYFPFPFLVFGIWYFLMSFLQPF